MTEKPRNVTPHVMPAGDAKADVAREKFEANDQVLDTAIARLEFRAEMKSSGEEEDSAVIDQRVLEAQRKKSSNPPKGGGYGQDAIWFIRSVRGWPQAITGLGLLAFLAFLAWLKWRH